MGGEINTAGCYNGDNFLHSWANSKMYSFTLVYDMQNHVAFGKGELYSHLSLQECNHKDPGTKRGIFGEQYWTK